MQYKAVDDMPTMDYQHSGDSGSRSGVKQSANKESDLTQTQRGLEREKKTVASWGTRVWENRPFILTERLLKDG